jgi:hypothetical protein
MKRFIQAWLSGAAATLLLSTSLSAQAVTVTEPVNYLPPITYLFSGNCVDCAAKAGTGTYAVTGTLVLKGANYQPNQQLGIADFLSFSYGGSNLFDAFEISSANIGSFFASYGNPLAMLQLETRYGAKGANYRYFNSQENRTWATGSNVISIADYGNAGAWTQISHVPEPGSLVLLGLGLAGLLAARQRRQPGAAPTQGQVQG